MTLFKKTLLSIVALIPLFADLSHAMEGTNKYLFNNYKKRLTLQELEKYYLNGSLKDELDKRFQKGLLIPPHNNIDRIAINGQEYYLKLDTSRVIGAALINELAEEYKLKVKAPIKKIYRDPKGKEYCLVPVIQSTHRHFSLAQVRHICKVIEIAEFDDMDCNNIINVPDGTVYFIDTEAKSFADIQDHAQWPAIQRALTLDTFKSTTEMTDSATAFLSKKIAQLNVSS